MVKRAEIPFVEKMVFFLAPQEQRHRSALHYIFFVGANLRVRPVNDRSPIF